MKPESPEKRPGAAVFLFFHSRKGTEHGAGGSADGEYRQRAQKPQQIDLDQGNKFAAIVHEFGIGGEVHTIPPFLK